MSTMDDAPALRPNALAASRYRIAPAAVAQEGPALDARSRFVLNAITWAFVLSILTMKISIGQIETPILFVWGLLLVLGLKGYVKVNPGRGALYFIFAGTILLSSTANASNFSPLSALSVVAFYAIFIFSIEMDRATYMELLKRYQIIAIGVALLVFSNWGFNLIHQPWPNLNKIIPKELQYINYVYIQPIHWGSPYIKPNAIFFLETSHTGQFLGLGTIIEVCFFRRITFIAILALATMLTFSGTGLALILLSSVFMIRYIEPRYLIAGLLSLPLVFGTAYSVGLVDNALKRTGEFSGQRASSGSGRFIEPYKMAATSFDGPVMELLFGVGAGRGKKDQYVLLNPPVKVILEYGIITFVAFFVFMNYSVIATGVPFVVAWALLIQYHILNGSMLVPLHIMYCYLLAGAYTLPRQERKARDFPAEDRLRSIATPAE